MVDDDTTHERIDRMTDGKSNSTSFYPHYFFLTYLNVAR